MIDLVSMVKYVAAINVACL